MGRQWVTLINSNAAPLGLSPAAPSGHPAGLATLVEVGGGASGSCQQWSWGATARTFVSAPPVSLLSEAGVPVTL